MAQKITKSFYLSLDRERQTGQRRRRRKDSKEERGIGENFVPVPGAVGRGARAAEKSLERRTETGKTVVVTSHYLVADFIHASRS